ncbi:MAG: hypothetical protein WBR10_05835, partial [Candidatus Acidiferrum sp.]
LNFDFSLTKNFPLRRLREHANLEFRSEFFNIFNHPLFKDPDTSFTDPTFGQITNIYGNPRIIQLASSSSRFRDAGKLVPCLLHVEERKLPHTQYFQT